MTFKPVEQVCPKQLLAHELPEILVCRRHHPHVDADGLSATQTLELPLLQDA